MSRPWFLLKADLDAPDVRLQGLRADPPPDAPPDPGAVADALERALGPQQSVEVLGWTRGTFHWVARVRQGDRTEVAARFLRLDLPVLREGLRVGAETAALAREGGLPAPEPLHGVAPALDDLPPLAVSRWVEGSPLSGRDHDEPAVERALGELGGHLRRLHGVTGSGAGPLAPGRAEAAAPTGRHPSWAGYLGCRLEEHLAACHALGSLGASEAAEVRRSLMGAEWWDAGPVDRLLHGDAGPANLVVETRGAVAGLLDWEDAMVGDPVFELASCASFHPERRWPALFEGYLGRASLPASLAGRFWRYSLRLALARTVARGRFGLGDLPGRQPAAARIQRALAALARAG